MNKEMVDESKMKEKNIEATEKNEKETLKNNQENSVKDSQENKELKKEKRKSNKKEEINKKNINEDKEEKVDNQEDDKKKKKEKKSENNNLNENNTNKENNSKAKEEKKKEKIKKEKARKNKNNQETENNGELKQVKGKEAEKKKKEMTKGEKNKGSKKKKIIITLSIIGVILIIGLIFSTIFSLININNSKIVSGVKIEGIDVSGLTQDEARGKLETIYNEKKEKEIPIKYQEFESSINPSMIELNYDIDKSIKEAMEVGRNENIFVNNYNILSALLGKKDISVDMAINEDATKKLIEDTGANLPGVVVESSYYIEEDNLIITKGKEGVKIDTDNLLNKLKERLDSIEITDEYIEIPVIQKKPEEINVDKIHEEVYKEVQDAYYTKDPFTIHPEVEGVDFNVDEAKAMIAAEDKEEYVIKLTITKPKVTVNDIGTEAFPDKLGTFTTRYDAKDADRTTNLRLACQKLNNKVVMPGETFSYNQTLGERTIAAGYKNAKVYENGQVVDGIGGGICQISSTLYNAVLLANLDIVERRNHQFVTSYVEAGRDATVVYGTTDFRFKNTRKYPIKIIATANSGIATISIYGIKEETEYDISFQVNRIATIPTSTKYVEDSSLPVGTEKVKQKGANGVKTETYIIKSLNGKVVSKELLSRDTYNAMQKIVLKGTKGASTTNTDNTGTQDNTQNQTPTNPSTTPPVTPPTEETPSPPTTPEEGSGSSEGTEENTDNSVE